jgi:hypothetical protein
VDETVVSELEAAIADTGALLVQAQKYRRAADEEGTALARDTLALGDRARRLHRHGTLAPESAATLLAEARELHRRARTFLASIHDAPEYRAAVTAYASGDQVTLRNILPGIFADLAPADSPAALFHPVAWLRRGRLRPIADVTADIVALTTTGLTAEGDDLSPGRDTALPAITLSAAPPPEEAVVLRLAAPTIPIYRLDEGDEYLIYTPNVRITPEAILADQLPTDEQLRVEISPNDYKRYRDDLRVALIAAGVNVG